MRWRSAAVAALTGLATVASAVPAANAVSITLNLVDSFVRTTPFGLAFDGTNVWYGDFAGSFAHEMTTAGVDTGNTTPAPVGGAGWNAMAWSGTQLITGSNAQQTIYMLDRNTGANQSSLTVTGATGGNQFSLVDGLDFDHNQFWWSPDVGNVFVLDNTGANALGAGVAVIGGAGGFSGVERIDIGANSFLIVVNDAFSPRKLCAETLAGVEIGCTTLSNSRYEDLAFDGRFLYAADLFGNKIDKIDLLVDGVSIFVPPDDGQVPEPGTLMLFAASLAGLGLIRRRKAA
ncbi:MAG: PEP-CTERM sorting domain-containing protein [Proteobacteria bacterium]|nr:PEP-CTERM sorting domain-containing protein [Pseudomonadota bacterium]